jgi:hypothetical protein
MKQVTFKINHPGESGAGIRSFSDTITIEIESGDPGGDVGEFEEHLKQTLIEWYDGAKVELIKVDWNRR